MKMLPLLAGLALLPLGAAPHAAAAPTMQQILRDTYGLHDLAHVSLARNGSAVAWEDTSRPGADPSMSAPHSSAFLLRTNARAGSPVRLGSDPSAEVSEPGWSPDGTKIAFLSKGATGPATIFTVDANGGNPRRIASLTGNVQGLTWSPNGRFFGILYIAHPHRKAGALAAGARDVGVIGSVVDEQQLATVDARTGALRMLTPSNTYVYEYAWAPDSADLTYTYALGNGDNNWWVARLASISVADRTPRVLYKPAAQINDPQWSPDGKRIAFIGGIMSDFGSVGGDVYVFDTASKRVRDVTPGAHVSAASIRWIDAAHLYMAAHDRGALHLLSLDTNTGAMKTVAGGSIALRSWDAVRIGNGVLAAEVRTSFEQAPELYVQSGHSLAQLTRVNAGAQRLWGKAVSLHWPSGGYNVQGWLIYPLSFDPRKRYPMVTIVHGGPSAESLPGFGNRFIAALSSQGYFVLEPNPRGSFGQGEKFARANVKDFGYGDWRDDLKGMDAAIEYAPIDPHRLGLFGWSYGGYMAMWAETQTTRLKAIVAGAGVVNWQSYYGQNNIDQWMIPFFGASVYKDPAVYAKSSPITFIEHSKTPVLILQGERDEEVPAPQAFEFYHAMRTLGVPSQLVVYADEGHSPSKPADQVDILTRMLGWFRHYL